MCCKRPGSEGADASLCLCTAAASSGWGCAGAEPLLAGSVSSLCSACEEAGVGEPMPSSGVGGNVSCTHTNQTSTRAHTYTYIHTQTTNINTTTLSEQKKKKKND